jgi:NAD(P)-dependent dehydrogenase (short-subunit alcohol dehydrogenase family)
VRTTFEDYQASPDLLAGKVILVTGAGDGIGKAAALSFAQHGATLILAGRTVAKLEQVYDQIVASTLLADSKQQCAEPTLYPVDFNGASEEDYATLAEKIVEQYGRLDGLLLNASELGERTPIANYKLSSWQQVMNTNVTSQFLLTKALLDVLGNAEEASILFTTSSVGRKGRAFWGAYAVSKFATEGLCQVLADELEGMTHIRVNCINPGATRTYMRAKAYPAEDPRTIKGPEDIMPAYLYLMGPDSTEVTGQSLNAQ